MDDINKQERLRELYNRYWNHTFELAKKCDFNPWSIIRITNKKTKKIENITGHPIFTYFKEESHSIEFPEFILEGIPIFKGDIIFYKTGDEVKVVEYNNRTDVVTVDAICEIHPTWTGYCSISELSSTPPEKTITLTNKEIDLLAYHVRNSIMALSTKNIKTMQCILNKLEN